MSTSPELKKYLSTFNNHGIYSTPWSCCSPFWYTGILLTTGVNVSLMVQSKKRGLSIDEKKQVVLQMFHESKDIYMLKVSSVKVVSLDA